MATAPMTATLAKPRRVVNPLVYLDAAVQLNGRPLEEGRRGVGTRAVP